MATKQDPEITLELPEREHVAYLPTHLPNSNQLQELMAKYHQSCRK